MKNWPRCWAQMVVVSSTKSNWWLVRIGALQGLMLRPVVFHISLTRWLKGCNASTANCELEVGETVNVVEAKPVLLRDPSTPQRCANRNFMKFNN